jgi:ribonuclease D
MLTGLRGQALLAVDTESDSFYHYYPKVCLIQLSAHADGCDNRAMRDYLVDPLRLRDVSALGALLSNTEVVMHAAENDLLLLARDFGFVMRRVFDTQLAARILGWPRAGLAAILEERFSVVSNKRMQRTDWSRRPLTAEQMAYGAMDTRYLLPLREVLIAELKVKGRWEEAQDAFEQLAQEDYRDRPVEQRTLWDMKATRDVAREDHGVLAALWEWREAEAKRRDIAPFRITGDAALVELAQRQPANGAELRRIRSLGERELARYSSEILRTIRDARSRPLPPLPRSERLDAILDPAVRDRFDALRAWRAQVAEQRGVALDIVLNNAALQAIAQHNPRTLEALNSIPGLSPWKRSAYGAAILDKLRKPSISSGA